MIDLDDRLRTHLGDLRDRATVAPGDLAAVPARATRQRRAQRRRAVLAGTAAVAALAAGVVVVAQGDGDPGQQVTADDPATGLEVAFQPVDGPSGVHPDHFLRVVDTHDSVAGLAMADDGLPGLWRTSDGETWERVTVAGVDAGDMFGGYLEEAGWRVVWGDDTGATPGPARIATAWVSRDGGPWWRAELPGGHGPDSGPHLGFLTARGPVLVGYQTDVDAPAVDLPDGTQAWPQVVVWSTQDEGATWSSNPLDRAQFGPDAEFGPLLGDGSGAVLQVLHRSDGHTSYWRTIDAVTWDRLEGEPFGAGAQLDALGPAVTGRLAIGTVGVPVRRPPGTVTSDQRGSPALWAAADDGSTWTPLGASLPPSGRFRSFATAGGSTAVLHATSSEHVHEADDPDRSLLTHHSRIGLLLLGPDGGRDDVDLTELLGLDPHVHATGIHAVGDRLLLDLTLLPTSLQDETVSTQLWLGTVTAD